MRYQLSRAWLLPLGRPAPRDFDVRGARNGGPRAAHLATVHDAIEMDVAGARRDPAHRDVVADDGALRRAMADAGRAGDIDRSVEVRAVLGDGHRESARCLAPV